MPTLLIALASALLLAALVTETSQRFWPDSYIALLVITFVALLINGLFNARLRQGAADKTRATSQPAQPRKNRQATNKSGSKKDDAGGRPRQDRGKQSKSGGKSGQQRNQSEPNKRKDSAPSKPATSSASPSAGPREEGTVKWFNRSKGYGFIIRENGEEVFVHQRSIEQSGDNRQRPVLRDGQKVSFTVAHMEKGAQAEQVKSLED